jgi:uncharacterized OsmC-like protein
MSVTYAVAAQSTDTFGRVLVHARDQHLVVDGPVPNGCPGEAVTPAEAFLGGVAACGVELVQVIARERGVGLARVGVEIEGVLDRANPVRPDVTVFNAVSMRFRLGGVGDEDAAALVEAFKGR